MVGFKHIAKHNARSLLTGGLLLLLAAAGCYFALIWRNRSTADWPHTEGVILESHRSGGFCLGKRLHIPFVSYRYEVDGTLQHGEGRPLWANCESSVDTDDIVRRYPAGKTPGTNPVTVYYDPTQPERSTLEPGTCRHNTGLVSGPCWDWRVLSADCTYQGTF